VLATKEWYVDSEPAGMVAACDGRDLNQDPEDIRIITSGLVLDFLKSNEHKFEFHLPTCPQCAVLWDGLLDKGSQPVR
jgi:hypothetical protein